MNTRGDEVSTRSSVFPDRMMVKLSNKEALEKYYGRPFEIMLRTHINDPYCLQSRVTNLPQGLMIASKKSINENQFISINLDNFGSHFIKRN